MQNMTITLAMAVEGLLTIVRKFGAEYTPGANSDVSGCTYARKDNFGIWQPVCIVGQYIANLGFLGVLINYEEDIVLHGACTFSAQDTQSGMWVDLAAHGLHFTDEAKFFLYAAQTEQDSDKPWGRAVTTAISQTHDWVVSNMETSRLVSQVEAFVNGDGALADWERELLGV